MFGIKWHWGSKDGGAESHVWAYGLEIKWLFSVLALRFEDGSRDAWHTHAFHALSWVLRGLLFEDELGSDQTWHGPSVLPILTCRDTNHKVTSYGRSWVISFRGPWAPVWYESTPHGKTATLTHGRRELHY